MVFHKMDVDATREEAKKHTATVAQRGVYWGIKKGRMTFRALPPWSAEQTQKGPSMLAHFHWVFKTRYVCPRLTWRDEFDSCPICDAVQQLKQANVGPKITGRLSANTKTLLNAVIRPAKDGQEEIIKVLEGPQQLHDWLMEMIGAEGKDAAGDFTATDESGTDIVAVRKGEGIDTKYAFSWSADRTGCPALSDADELEKLEATGVRNIHDILRVTDEDVENMKSVARKILAKYESALQDDGGASAEHEEMDRDEEPAEEEPETPAEKKARLSRELAEAEAEEQAKSEEAATRKAGGKKAKSSKKVAAKGKGKDLPGAGDETGTGLDGDEADPPPLDPKTGKPKCYKMFYAMNDGEEKPKHPTCKVCRLEAVCLHKSVKEEEEEEEAA